MIKPTLKESRQTFAIVGKIRAGGKILRVPQDSRKQIENILGPCFLANHKVVPYRATYIIESSVVQCSEFYSPRKASY